MIFLFVTFLLFLVGVSIGSFLNVVIYRSVSGESWTKGRSHCEHCRKRIHWYDNVPLLSYFVLRGKCRDCKKPIAIIHPVVEFLTGSLFVWWYWGGTFFFKLTEQPFHYIQPLFWLSVGILLLIIFFADALYSIIPDEAVGVLTLFTFLYRLALTLSGEMQPADFVKTLIGAVVCGGFFWSLWYFTKGRGMGFGDVKFAVPLALLLGWPNMLIGVFGSFMIGSVVAIILLLSKKKKLKQTVPFGPFMVASLVLTLLWGDQILRWYVSLL
jgi:leader peptidase (prepilin peptidase) / N-methyltransferase